MNRTVECGQNVEITQGPFEGMQALVTRVISARERVEVLINWMGRTLPAETDISDLQACGGAEAVKGLTFNRVVKIA